MAFYGYFKLAKRYRSEHKQLTLNQKITLNVSKYVEQSKKLMTKIYLLTFPASTAHLKVIVGRFLWSLWCQKYICFLSTQIVTITLYQSGILFCSGKRNNCSVGQIFIFFPQFKMFAVCYFSVNRYTALNCSNGCEIFIAYLKFVTKHRKIHIWMVPLPSRLTLFS